MGVGGNCGKPEGVGEFHETEAGRRCGACYRHMVIHNKEGRPEQLYLKDEWRATRVKEVLPNLRQVGGSWGELLPVRR